jgi:hypothetical protein
MASKVEIVNLALLQIGDEIIMSLDEDTKAARTMNAIYDSTLREVLEDHTWGFAKARTSLAPLVATPTFEFAHAYQLPVDFVRMVYMGELGDELVWHIEGQTLVTDEDEANIVYIRMIEDPGIYPGKFVTAFACLLALRGADSIAGSNQSRQQGLQKAYDKLVADAATVDSQNSSPPVLRANRWHNARTSGVVY